MGEEVFSTVGDSMSTMGGAEYRGGESFVIWVPPDIPHMYHDVPHPHDAHNIPHVHHDIPHGTEYPPRHWVSPTALIIPHSTQDNPHGTHDIPHGTEHPHGT